MPFPSIYSSRFSPSEEDSKEEDVVRNQTDTSLSARFLNAFGRVYGNSSTPPRNNQTPTPISPVSNGTTTGNNAPLTDPELAAKLLYHYIKSYPTQFSSKVLGINPATLRYIISRIREMKRAPPNARFSILDFFKKSDELSSYDFAHIESCFKTLKKVQIIGNNNATELDLRFFLNLTSLRVSNCDVVYIGEPEEWTLYQIYRLKDIRIVKSSFPISGMKAIPDKLIVVQSELDWESINEAWIAKIQEIDCTQLNIRQLSSILVPQTARKVSNQEEIQNQEDESDSYNEGSQLCIGWLELSKLVLTKSNIKHIDQSLLYCPQLEYLDLSSNKIENLDVSSFGKPLRKLNTLIIRSNNLESLSLSKNLLEFLKVLDVSHNQLTNTVGLEDAQVLENLDLSYNSLIDWRDVKRLRKLSQLNTLSLHHNSELEKNKDYRSVVISYLNGKTKLYNLDGKSIVLWEKGTTVLASSDSDHIKEDKLLKDKNDASSLQINNVDEILKMSNDKDSLLKEKSNLLSQKIDIKIKKKKFRKHLRKVKEIPEIIKSSQELSNEINNNEELEQIKLDENNIQTTNTLDQNSDLFFSQMSHFYESAQVDDNNNSNSVQNKDVEWTKQQLSSMREDGGDQWLLILNEYINPDRNRRFDNNEDKKQEPDLTNSYNESNQDYNFDNQRARTKVPSFRNPIQQVRVMIDFVASNSLPTSLLDPSVDIGRMQRVFVETSFLFNQNDEQLKDEVMDFFKQLGLENEGERMLSENIAPEYDINDLSDLSETSSNHDFITETIHDDSEDSYPDTDAEDPTAFVSVVQPNDNSYISPNNESSILEVVEKEKKFENFVTFDSSDSDTSSIVESFKEDEILNQIQTPIEEPKVPEYKPQTTEKENQSNIEDNTKIETSMLEFKTVEKFETITIINELQSETQSIEIENEIILSNNTQSTIDKPKNLSLDIIKTNLITIDSTKTNNQLISDSNNSPVITSVDSSKTKITPTTPPDTSSFDNNDSSSIEEEGQISNAVKRFIDENSKQSQILISGNLYKEGGGWKSWKRRFFTLTELQWSYGKFTNHVIDVIETNNISSVKKVKHTSAKPKNIQQFGFSVSVEGDNSRVYKVCAESEEQLNEWVNALNLVIKNRESNKRSMLLSTNGNIFRLKHAASNLYMDISNTGKLIFTKSVSGNNNRWRHISGRLTNENLGTVLVCDSEGNCYFIEQNKSPGKESIWKAENGIIFNENSQILTVKGALSKDSIIEGYATTKRVDPKDQIFIVE